MSSTLPLFDQLYHDGSLAMVTVRSCVYELPYDNATGDTHPLYKQINTPMLVAGYHKYRRPHTTFKAILEEVSKLYGEGVELKQYHLYPLIPNQPVKNPDTLDENDEFNYTVMYGYTLEERRNDPKEPILVRSDEDATKAVEEALTPYYVLVPFVLAMPEDKRFMYNISFDYTPISAVNEYDSSKKETVPEPEEELPIQANSQGTFISPEDLVLHRKIRECMEQQAHDAEVDGKLPEGFRVDEEKIAKDVGLPCGEAVAEFLRKFQANMAEINDLMPEFPPVQKTE